MEWVCVIAIIIAYSSLSSQIAKINNNLGINKKKFPSLKDMINQEIELELDGEISYSSQSKKGILKSYDDIWIVIECLNKKNQKETYYYRLNQIKAINIIE